MNITNRQARRIAMLTTGYRDDAQFEIWNSSSNIIVHVSIYNLLYLISKDGSGVARSKHTGNIIDEFSALDKET